MGRYGPSPIFGQSRCPLLNGSAPRPALPCPQWSCWAPKRRWRLKRAGHGFSRQGCSLKTFWVTNAFRAPTVRHLSGDVKRKLDLVWRILRRFSTRFPMKAAAPPPSAGPVSVFSIEPHSGPRRTDNGATVSESSCVPPKPIAIRMNSAPRAGSISDGPRTDISAFGSGPHACVGASLVKSRKRPRRCCLCVSNGSAIPG